MFHVLCAWRRIYRVELEVKKWSCWQNGKGWPPSDASKELCLYTYIYIFIVWSFARFVVSHRFDHFLQLLPPSFPPALLGPAASFIFSILRMLRLVRVMRLLRLLRKSRALRELQKSLGGISMRDYVTAQLDSSCMLIMSMLGTVLTEELFPERSLGSLGLMALWGLQVHFLSLWFVSLRHFVRSVASMCSTNSAKQLMTVIQGCTAAQHLAFVSISVVM